MNDVKPSQRTAQPFRCDHCSENATEREGGVLRCACGSLLARYVDGGLELKCRRCKRTVFVPTEAAAAS